MSDEIKIHPDDGEVVEDSAQARLNKLEEEAEKNYEERKEEERKRVEMLERDRENADSRKSWQTNADKTDKDIGGQTTKGHTVFARPETSIFDGHGKLSVFKTAEKRRKLARVLKREARGGGSAQARGKYVGLLEQYNKVNRGAGLRNVKELDMVCRRGVVGMNKRTRQFVKSLIDKGEIKQAKDLAKMVDKRAFRKIKDVMINKAEDIGANRAIDKMDRFETLNRRNERPSPRP